MAKDPQVSSATSQLSPNTEPSQQPLIDTKEDKQPPPVAGIMDGQWKFEVPTDYSGSAMPVKGMIRFHGPSFDWNVDEASDGTLSGQWEVKRDILTLTPTDGQSAGANMTDFFNGLTLTRQEDGSFHSTTFMGQKIPQKQYLRLVKTGT